VVFEPRVELVFEPTRVGLPVTKTIDLRNGCDDGAVNVTLVLRQGTEGFDVVEPDPVVIDPGATYPMEVRFIPAASGTSQDVALFELAPPLWGSRAVSLRGRGE
jgi:hypothetical protein